MRVLHLYYSIIATVLQSANDYKLPAMEYPLLYFSK